MDVTSYLLGKQAGGGSTPTLQDKSVTITENGTTNVTADTGYDGLREVEITTNVSADLSEYIYSTVTNSSNSYYGYTRAIKKMPHFSYTKNDASYLFKYFQGEEIEGVTFVNGVVTGCEQIFNNCPNLKSLIELPLTTGTYDRLNLTSFALGCSNLENVPIYDMTKVIRATNAFGNCPKLTDTSLDNILQSLISATSYTGTKTLADVGINDTTIYPASRIQALPHYQDFIDAGWTIS